MSTVVAELPAVLRINDTAPDFTAEPTRGTIRFHDWIGDGWRAPKPYLRIVPQPK